MSLVDRLTGRKQPGAPPVAPAQPATPEESNGMDPALRATSTFSRFTEETQGLSAVDQLKVDIQESRQQ